MRFSHSVLVFVSLLAASVFDRGTAEAWLLSSCLAFVLDSVVYHTVYLCATACYRFLRLVRSGCDGSTLPR